jgi:hypothetical protein
MQHPVSTKTHPTTTNPAPRARRGQSRQMPRRGFPSRMPASAPQPGARVQAAALTGGRASAAERTEVEAMSRAERIAAMHEGRLSLPQLTYWSGRYGDDVPLIGGEFAYIAVFEPGYCEATSAPALARVPS